MLPTQSRPSTQLLARVAGRGFLLAIAPDGRAFDWVEQFGDEVRKRYWADVQPYSISGDVDCKRAARTLTELGYASKALAALTMIVHNRATADPSSSPTP